MIKNDVQYNYYDTYAGPPPYYSKLYRFSKDTMINSNHYKRLDVSSDSINWVNTPYFFHEDSIENKVYLFYNDTVGLLYDFSASTGDTVDVYNPAFGTYSHPLIVNSVDSMLLSGKYHKTVQFSSNYWIEGIGDIYGIMAPGREQIGVSETLVCYHLQGSLLYINNLYSSCFFNSSGINDSDIEDYVNVFPNPFTDKIRIENKNAYDVEYIIYNSLGQKITMPTKINALSYSELINMESMHSVIYFVQISSENAKRTSLKIIKY
jgi:Secretion system C-terminal sorting domain